MGKKEKQQKQGWSEGENWLGNCLLIKKEISIRELDEKAKEQGISGKTMRDVRSRMKNELEYRVNEKQENSIRLKEWWVAESLKQIQIFIDTLSATCCLPAYEYFQASGVSKSRLTDNIKSIL